MNTTVRFRIASRSHASFRGSSPRVVLALPIASSVAPNAPCEWAKDGKGLLESQRLVLRAAIRGGENSRYSTGVLLVRAKESRNGRVELPCSRQPGSDGSSGADEEAHPSDRGSLEALALLHGPRG